MKNHQPTSEEIVRYLRERIYGSITIMAINIGLLFSVEKLTVVHAAEVVGSTALGLWLAGLFAELTAYRIVHDKAMPRHDFLHEFRAHSGLLMAAIPSLLILAIAGLGVIELRTALITDIVMAITASTLLILRSAKTQNNSFHVALLSAGLQSIIATLIIAIKLVAH